MKVWAVIYNIFGSLLVMFIVLVLFRDINENERQLQELRLKYAVDYATEGAFQASLEGGNLGISYQDLQNIKVVPENVLSVFKGIMMTSYGMSYSEQNFIGLDNYISGAVLALADGYYILSPKDFNDSTLIWGLKKPYTVKYSNTEYIAYNISNQNWMLARNSAVNPIVRGDDWASLRNSGFETGVTDDVLRQKITTLVNRRLTDDINYSIKQRNMYRNSVGTIESMGREVKLDDFVYLPSVQTDSGVNSVTKPSLLMIMSGVDFAGVSRLDSKSIGGLTVAKKVRVLAYSRGGKLYYCYEGQLPSTQVVDRFFNSTDEAAKAGYTPDLKNLIKPMN